MPHIKPLSRALELATYASERTVAFRLVGRGAVDASTAEVHVPLSIAYRIFYLGRAFDGQAIKSIEPRGSTSVDYVKLQVLISELELVGQAVRDPVSQHYLGLLLPLLASSRAHTTSPLNLIAP